MDKYTIKISYSEDQTHEDSGKPITDKIYVKYPDPTSKSNFREFQLERSDISEGNILLDFVKMIGVLQENFCDPAHENKRKKIKDDLREIKNLQMIQEILDEFSRSDNEDEKRANDLVYSMLKAKILNKILSRYPGKKE